MSKKDEKVQEEQDEVVVVSQRDLDYQEQVQKDMEDGSFFNDWSADDMAEFQSKMLGHDESLKTGDKKVIGAVIKRLADDMGLVRKFRSVNVLHSENTEFLACVNMHDRGLYINASNDFLAPSDLVRTIRGLILHECFSGDSIVTLGSGRKRRIEDIHRDLEAGREVFVKTLDVGKRAFTVKPVVACFKDSSDELYEVVIGRRKIDVTGNHPFLVLDKGVLFWKRVDELEEKDEVVIDRKGYRKNIKGSVPPIFLDKEGLVRLFPEKQRGLIRAYDDRVGVSHLNLSDGDIAKIHDVERHTIHRYRKGQVVPFGVRIIGELEQKGLLPFDPNTEKINVLGRFVGYFLGNGWLTSTRQVVGVGCTNSEDAELVLNDLRYLGFEGKFRPVNCSVVVEDASLWYFLKGIGVPVGKRVEQSFKLPEWVYWLDGVGRSEFLAGLFGSDGRKPFFQNKSPNPINLKFSKKKEHIGSLADYMKDIQQLVEQFGVKTRLSEPFKNEKNLAVELRVLNSHSNIKKFLEKIGYAYSVKGKALAGKALEYLLEGKRERQKKYHVSNFNDYSGRFSFSSSDIKFGKIKSVRKKTVSNDREVFNLSVAGTNNYLVGGVVVKNCGHLNDFLGVPSTKEVGQRHMKQVQKAKADAGILNWVYDLEIHYQANERKLFHSGDQLALREFLSAVRSAMEKVEPTNPLLCMESGPKTEFQEKVKAIIENRGKGVVWKTKEISKLWKKEGPKQDGKGQGQGKCTCKEEGKKKGECDNCKNAKRGRKLTVVVVDDKHMEKVAGKHYKVNDITKKIEKEAKLKELQEKIERRGISAGTVAETVRYFESKGDPLEHMEELAKSLTDMMKFDSGFLKSTVSEEKTGSRLNGIRPMRDIDEVTENVEQLVTDGKYDIENIKIPRKIKRKLKGYAFIIRDVSGSIAFEDVSKVVRDATMFILSECKRAKHKVCVIDFDTDTYTMTDRDGNEITERHEEILCKSSYLKVGGGTDLGVAIDKLNILIRKEKLKDIPINVYVITDSEISHYHRVRNEFDRQNGKAIQMKEVRVGHNKFTLTGLVYNTSDRSDSDSNLHVDPEFKEFIKRNGGRTFFIRLDDTQKLVKGLKAI